MDVIINYNTTTFRERSSKVSFRYIPEMTFDLSNASPE